MWSFAGVMIVLTSAAFLVSAEPRPAPARADAGPEAEAASPVPLGVGQAEPAGAVAG
jgi:hypothetical protein